MHSLAFVTLGEQVHDRDRYPVIASGISLPSVYELDCRLGEIILPYKYSADRDARNSPSPTESNRGRRRSHLGRAWTSLAICGSFPSYTPQASVVTALGLSMLFPSLEYVIVGYLSRNFSDPFVNQLNLPVSKIHANRFPKFSV